MVMAPIGHRVGVAWPGAARTRHIVRLAAMLGALALGLVSLAQEAPSQPASPAAVPSGRQANNVAIIPIDEEISRITVYSFLRRLKIAEQGGADAGRGRARHPRRRGRRRDRDLRRDTELVDHQQRGLGALDGLLGGAIIALACKEIVTAAPARMGDALPIMFGFDGKLHEMAPAERQKATAPLIAEVVGSARLRGGTSTSCRGSWPRGRAVVGPRRPDR